MAKVSKLEEYWRQNNVENLLKDVTHVLTQRMPPDPALAIVQHLQRKFPKSFKASPEARPDTDTVPKLTTDTLRSRSIVSPRSDVNNESISDTGRTRRTSNQSQGSGTALVPSGRSAFTNLLNANVWDKFGVRKNQTTVYFSSRPVVQVKRPKYRSAIWFLPIELASRL